MRVSVLFKFGLIAVSNQEVTDLVPAISCHIATPDKSFTCISMSVSMIITY